MNIPILLALIFFGFCNIAPALGEDDIEIPPRDAALIVCYSDWGSCKDLVREIARAVRDAAIDSMISQCDLEEKWCLASGHDANPFRPRTLLEQACQIDRLICINNAWDTLRFSDFSAPVYVVGFKKCKEGLDECLAEVEENHPIEDGD